MPVPVQSPFSPQEFNILYLSIDGNVNTEVQSISIDRTDGGADVETLVRQYGGRVKGSAKATVNVRGVIPYLPKDTGGAGFASGGMVTGGSSTGGSGGVQLDQTILSNLNQNSNAPVTFMVAIGQPAAQQLVFRGFIHMINVDVSVGQQATFNFTASGEFSTFG